MSRDAALSWPREVFDYWVGRIASLVPDDDPCIHIPAESVRDDGVRLCAICHEPLKESE